MVKLFTACLLSSILLGCAPLREEFFSTEPDPEGAPEWAPLELLRNYPQTSGGSGWCMEPYHPC